MRVFEVAENVFGEEVEEYTNGILTTAGFVPTDQLKQAEGVTSITYDSEHADCLPPTYAEHTWLDDRNIRQYIEDIDFDTDGLAPAYTMEDGSTSWTVTS